MTLAPDKNFKAASEAALSQPILEVEGLTVSVRSEQGQKPLISDISFTLKKGEILAIAGESGSGKSITSLAIIGLLPPRCSSDRRCD